MLDFTCGGYFAGPLCTCPSSPCVDPALDSGNTQSDFYWSATDHVSGLGSAWLVHFDGGYVSHNVKTTGYYVVAVRGGL